MDRQRVQAEQGEKEKARWDRARVLAKEGKFDDIPSDIYIRQYANLHSINQDSMPKLPALDRLDNLWIYGPTGVGKSRYVRDLHPDVYPKPRNKWWDGYADEAEVVIEEVSPDDEKWIAPFLKV